MRPPRRLVRERPQRTRIFVGCEGESEQSYVALLQRFADIAGQFVHLDSVLLQPGGGDPLAIIEKAAREVSRREDRHGEPYAHRFVLLDADKLGQSPDRDRRGHQLAREETLSLVWQRPCHEALLLRHLPGFHNHDPQSTAIAIQQLGQQWLEYRKGMAAQRLSETLTVDGARRVGQGDAAFNAMLQAIGIAK